jgi:hypothetical protein
VIARADMGKDAAVVEYQADFPVVDDGGLNLAAT